jgi:hypothetical protein
MQTPPENPPQKPASSPRNKNLPPGLFVAVGLVLGAGAGVATGHLFWVSIAGVLLGGSVDISLALLNKRQKGKTGQQIG